jgi:hypothetical protein
MKKTAISLLCIFWLTGIYAQTNVVRMSASKSTNYGVEYFLPKTVLQIEVSYSKTVSKVGVYGKYAERMLGLARDKVIQEDAVTFTLDKLQAKSKGIPDKREGYLVEFKSKTTAPFVCLTEDGMICTINADYTPESEKKATAKPAQEKAAPTVNASSIYTEEYLRAGSTLKMAEVAAKQIYQIRENRNDLISGNAENAPRDGEGLKLVLGQLDAQEKALTELFTGTVSVENLTAEFTIEPQSEIEKEVVFRFSKYEGIVASDDLSGSPVYINVKKAEDETPETPSDAKKKEKEQASIVYNVPGKGAVEIFYGLNSLYKNTFLIVQFGKKQILAPSIFEDKKAPVKIYFYPETGAIRQIIQ